MRGQLETAPKITYYPDSHRRHETSPPPRDKPVVWFSETGRLNFFKKYTDATGGWLAKLGSGQHTATIKVIENIIASQVFPGENPLYDHARRDLIRTTKNVKNAVARSGQTSFDPSVTLPEWTLKGVQENVQKVVMNTLSLVPRFDGFHPEITVLIPVWFPGIGYIVDFGRRLDALFLDPRGHGAVGVDCKFGNPKNKDPRELFHDYGVQSLMVAALNSGGLWRHERGHYAFYADTFLHRLTPACTENDDFTYAQIYPGVIYNSLHQGFRPPTALQQRSQIWCECEQIAKNNGIWIRNSPVEDPEYGAQRNIRCNVLQPPSPQMSFLNPAGHLILRKEIADPFLETTSIDQLDHF